MTLNHFKMSNPKLEAIVSQFEKYRRIKLEIGGYTDVIGDDTYNQRLSERRAVVVVVVDLSK